MSTKVVCGDCDEPMPKEDLKSYLSMCGELQQSLTVPGVKTALCFKCLEIRKEEDDFTEEDFMAEFCG